MSCPIRSSQVQCQPMLIARLATDQGSIGRQFPNPMGRANLITGQILSPTSVTLFQVLSCSVSGVFIVKDNSSVTKSTLQTFHDHFVELRSGSKNFHHLGCKVSALTMVFLRRFLGLTCQDKVMKTDGFNQSYFWCEAQATDATWRCANPRTQQHDLFRNGFGCKLLRFFVCVATSHHGSLVHPIFSGKSSEFHNLFDVLWKRLLFTVSYTGYKCLLMKCLYTDCQAPVSEVEPEEPTRQEVEKAWWWWWSWSPVLVGRSKA